MKQIRLLLVPFALALAAVAMTATAQASSSERSGAVYTLTNSPNGNAVAVFDRDAHGVLTPAGTFATGGNGTGANLGSQGALALSADRKLLFAVNAASSTISELAVQPHSLQLVGTAASGGTTPISLTVHGNLLYVLNAGGAGSISGFTFGRDGISPIAGSTRPLGAGSAGPAQVAFSPDGASVRPAGHAYGLDIRGGDAVRLRLRPQWAPARLRSGRIGLVVQRPRRRSAPDHGTCVDERTGRALLARHYDGRPLCVHRERRLGHALRLLGRGRRLARTVEPEWDQRSARGR